MVALGALLSTAWILDANSSRYPPMPPSGWPREESSG
jgi:cytochrome bd-type quinol oxidase subunit 1